MYMYIDVKNQFQIASMNKGGQRITLSASSPQERDSWIEQLTNAIENANTMEGNKRRTSLRYANQISFFYHSIVLSNRA